MKPSSIKILRQELAEYYDINTKSYTQDRIIKESQFMLKQLLQSKRQLRNKTMIIEDYFEDLREILRPYKESYSDDDQEYKRFF